MDQPLPFSPVFIPSAPRPSKIKRGPEFPFYEKVLIAISILQFCFLPWAFGGMHVLTQWINGGLSICAAATALLLHSALRTPAKDEKKSKNSFWLLWRSRYLGATAVLGLYIVIQILNPAWRFVTEATSWSLSPTGYITWLPHGIDAPFARCNGWRWWLILVPLSLTLISISRGFSRRWSYAILISAIAANGAIIALFGLLQKFSHATKIFGAYRSSNYRFFASFIYPNHAGAYLNLTLGAAAAFLIHQVRNGRETKSAAPVAALCVFAIATITTGVVFSSSRMSIGLAALTLTILSFAILGGLQRAKIGSQRKTILGPALVAAVLTSLVALTLITQRGDPIMQRFTALAAHPAAALRDRTLAQQAGFAMFQGQPILGWGAGSFRYAFPIYLQNYPAIYRLPDGQLNYWEHVHNDWLEFAIELGLIGILPIVYILGNLAVEFVCLKIWKSGLALFLTVAASLTLVHATVDFVFQCPAVLFTWAILVLTALRWRKLEIAQIALAGKTSSG